MSKQSAGRIRIIGDQDETFRFRRNTGYLQRRADVDPSHVNFDGILPPCWKAELVIFILAPSAANEAITASSVTTAPLVISFRIVRRPIEIAPNRQT